MSHSKVHSRGNVPFSWENKPGVSKVTCQESCPTEENFVLKLQPPPSPLEKARISVHEFQIPLPPCAFQPPSRSSSKKGLRKEDDPFLAAYKECTKSTTKGRKSCDAGSGLKKTMSTFSCKRSCSVRDDNLVRISQLPSDKERRRGEKWA